MGWKRCAAGQREYKSRKSRRKEKRARKASHQDEVSAAFKVRPLHNLEYARKQRKCVVVPPGRSKLAPGGHAPLGTEACKSSGALLFCRCSARVHVCCPPDLLPCCWHFLACACLISAAGCACRSG